MLIKSPTGSSAKAVKDVLLVVQPNDMLHSQVIQDALAAELMSAGVTIVSRERHLSVELEQFAASEREDEKEPQGAAKAPKPDKKSGTGPLEIAKASGATFIVTMTILGDTIQRNVYEPQTARIAEVRTEQVIRSVSCAVVRVSNGELVACGYCDYAGGEKTITVTRVANEWGKALARQLLQ